MTYSNLVVHFNKDFPKLKKIPVSKQLYRNVPPYINEVKSGLSQRALAVIQLDESDLARASGHKALLSRIVTSCSGAAQLL